MGNMLGKFKIKFAVGASFFALAMGAFAANPTMTLTGAGSYNIMDGVYVNPYDGRVNYPNGTVLNASIICNDFFAHNSIGQTWSVTELTVGSLTLANITQTRWGQGLTTDAAKQAAILTYQRGAYLATQLMATSDLATQGQLSFALWGLFNPSALNYVTGFNKTKALEFLAAAQSMTFAAGSFANVSIFTPSPLNGPQEMFVVRTPEPGAIALLLVNAAFGLGMIVLLRRRAAAARL